MLTMSLSEPPLESALSMHAAGAARSYHRLEGSSDVAPVRAVA